MCKNLEAAGVSFLTVHARTPAQRCQPINEEALTLINQSVSVPIIANGDVRTLADAHYLQEKTGCKGKNIFINIIIHLNLACLWHSVNYLLEFFF